MAVNVNVKKLKENATIPTYGTEYAAGADLYACIEEAVTIEAGETSLLVLVLQWRFLKVMPV